MYEQGKSSNFEADRFFDPSKYWYHIATNARPSTSVWRKIQGKATTCDNVITQYAAAENGNYAYRNACYVKGQYKKSLNRSGLLMPHTQRTGEFVMVDNQSKQEAPYVVLSTDYDHFALIGDGQGTFWILSRTPEICRNTLLKLEAKLKSLNFDVSALTVDFRVTKECSAANVENK